MSESHQDRPGPEVARGPPEQWPTQRLGQRVPSNALKRAGGGMGVPASSSLLDGRPTRDGCVGTAHPRLAFTLAVCFAAG